MMFSLTEPEIVVAIDVGKWVSGLALFRDGELLSATEVGFTPLARETARHLPGETLARDMADRLEGAFWTTVAGRHSLIAVEKMVDYEAKGARERDLDQLRTIVEMLRERAAALNIEFAEVRAHTWKGNVPKHVTAHRVRGILTDEEFERISPWSKETWDAVGIGLFKVGRAGRGSTPV